MSGPGGRPAGAVPVRGVRVAGTMLCVSIVGSTPAGGAPAEAASRGYVAEAAETGDVVELLVREQLPDDGLAADAGTTRAGQAIVLSVALVRPLAGRRVVDRSTGSAVLGFSRVLTVRPAAGWTLRSERAEGQTWRQAYAGPGGELFLNQGLSQVGVVSHPASFERTGVTTVRGEYAEWGSTPGKTSLHWVEDRDGVQLMSPDLPLDMLVEIANGLVAIE
jgi:hypothetical protein